MVELKKWVRKENPVAVVKAAKAEVELFSAQDVDELFQLIKQRNTPKECQQ